VGVCKRCDSKGVGGEPAVTGGSIAGGIQGEFAESADRGEIEWRGQGDPSTWSSRAVRGDYSRLVLFVKDYLQLL
jgi:hypothetical protein